MRNVWKFYPKSKEVVNILEQVPKGVRTLFIEQAILDFASRRPSIDFFFEGITKPKRTRRKKQQGGAVEVVSTPAAIQKPIQPQPAAPLASQEASVAADEDGGKMMFGFDKMGLR